MTRTLRGSFPLLILLAFAFAFNGCDEPNDPDLPRHPYTLVNQLTTQGIAKDVYMAGNLVAVAEDMYGALVLDATDPRALDTVFEYTNSPGGSCTQLALAPTLTYLCVFPQDNFFYSVFNYSIPSMVEAQIPIGLSLNGPLGDMEVTAMVDTLFIWGTDMTASDNFFTGLRYTRASDTSAWEFNPTNQSFVPSNGRVHGFDIRSDGIAAIAVEQQGVRLHRIDPFESLGLAGTPGLAYDCAWSGNYVVVADQFQVVIVDASDLMQPVVVSQVRIPNADRLRQVAVDGNYACVLDEYDGIYIVDISNPVSPQYVQLLDLYDPTAVVAGNGRVYVTDEGNGLLVYSR
ncbi:MAG: hypothetical protein ACOZB3_06080 [Calditrichota bacterium]